jgi:hypothetical protein
MLAPHDRSLLFDLLRPPDGYRLDAAVGTTYSLDLLAMLVAPLAFTLFDWENKDGRIVASPFALLESLRRHASHITLFCQAGEIQVPARHRQLFGYLERSVVEVRPPTEARVFHPKMWLLRLIPATNVPSADWPVLYRLLCPSRNLTFDRSWDTMLVLEGRYRARSRRNEFNAPLAEFLRRLPELAVRPLPTDAATEPQRMAEEVLRVEFEPPDGFDQIRFWPLGLDGERPWPFTMHDEEIERLLVVSPFVSDALVRRLASGVGSVTVVSRADELAALSLRTIRRLQAVFTLDPAAEVQSEEAEPQEPHVVTTEESKAEQEENEPGEIDKGSSLSGLHAKVYVANVGDRGYVWTGSANATDAAFGGNVELLVELSGDRETCGVDAMLDPDDGRGFRGLLQPYVPPHMAEVNGVDERLDHALDGLQRTIAAHDLQAVLVRVPDEDLFDLRIQAATPLPHSWADGAVGCRPVTVPDHWRKPIDSTTPAACFARLVFERITSFFVFTAEVEVENRRKQRQFVVNVPLQNEPPDRRERLLFSLLRNSDQVMRYLLLLLADDGWDARSAIEILDEHDKKEQSTHPKNTNGPLELPLLEALLRSLTKDPAKLDRIAQLMSDLEKTPQGQSLIPPGFGEVWRPVWQAREALTP